MPVAHASVVNQPPAPRLTSGATQVVPAFAVSNYHAYRLMIGTTPVASVSAVNKPAPPLMFGRLLAAPAFVVRDITVHPVRFGATPHVAAYATNLSNATTLRFGTPSLVVAAALLATTTRPVPAATAFPVLQVSSGSTSLVVPANLLQLVAQLPSSVLKATNGVPPSASALPAVLLNHAVSYTHLTLPTILLV